MTGRIFDDRGNRMSPSHSRKGVARHRYYVSSALIQGQPQSAGSVARVPAAKIEAVVLDAVRRHIGHDAPVDNPELITTYVRQIEVRRTEIAISLMNEENASEDEKDNPLVLTVPWSKTPHRIKGRLAAIMEFRQQAGLTRKQAAEWVVRHLPPKMKRRLGSITSATVESWLVKWGGERGAASGNGREGYLSMRPILADQRPSEPDLKKIFDVLARSLPS